MLLEELLSEKKKEKKENPIIFIETDPQSPFPNDTMSALKKAIKKEAKDLDKNWPNAIELVNFVFKDWRVPMPGAYLRNRWEQYLELLKAAINALSDSRGLNGSWRISV